MLFGRRRRGSDPGPHREEQAVIAVARDAVPRIRACFTTDPDQYEVRAAIIYEPTAEQRDGPPPLDVFEQLVLAVNTWSVGDPPLLSTVNDSGVGATVHDDCYFYLETRHEELPGIVLGGLLATYIGAALLQESNDAVEVAMPPADLVSDLLQRSPTWTGELVSSAPREVAVGLATTGWKLGEEIPNAELGVVYDPATGAWSH